MALRSGEKREYTTSVAPFLDILSVPLEFLDFLLEICLILLFLSSTVRVVNLRGR